MTARRATPICERCLINPTEDVRQTVCQACWQEVIRAIKYRSGGPLAEYLRTWNQEEVKV